MEVRDLRITEYQVKAFETQVPSARIVRMPHASHYIFVSNEGDVLREMDAFISTLKNDQVPNLSPVENTRSRRPVVMTGSPISGFQGPQRAA